MRIEMIKIVCAIILACISVNSFAGMRFQSKYSCSDTGRRCVDSGTRMIDGFEVYRDCWEYSYDKKCNHPSKNDCQNYRHCYLVKELPCLLRDHYGNCINVAKEFSCKSWDPVTIDKEVVRQGLKEKDGQEQMICTSIACIDGNCFNKSFTTNDEMMESISYLDAVSKTKGALDINFKLFEGYAQSCSKKAASYSNCCSVGNKGWGKNLGARCSSGEKDLMEKRKKNLCVYVGADKHKTLGATTLVKHQYCCFGSLMNKIIQVEAKKKLPNINWGSAKKPNCDGVSLEDIMKLDFSEMDFSEFYSEIVNRLKMPSQGDIKSRLDSSMPNIQKYDNDESNKDNKYNGMNSKMEGDKSGDWE